MSPIPKLQEIINFISNEENLLQFLLNYGILYSRIQCQCGKEHEANIIRKSFRCHSRGNEYERSILWGSFFYSQNLSIGNILLIGYYWLTNVSVLSTINHLGHSPNTICSYFKYYRELVMASLTINDTIIGGEGIEIDIDETKLGKRKYNRGHHVEGVWVIGGVERTPNRNLFLVAIPNRSAEVLLEIISRHVRPGSIINTDLWRGYSRIEEELGLRHNTVNHSLNFLDPQTRVHTNYIEGTWHGLKLRIPARNRVLNNIEGHLFEFMWRRINKNRLWDALLDALKDVHFDN